MSITFIMTFIMTCIMTFIMLFIMTYSGAARHWRTAARGRSLSGSLLGLISGISFVTPFGKPVKNLFGNPFGGRERGEMNILQITNHKTRKYAKYKAFWESAWEIISGGLLGIRLGSLSGSTDIIFLIQDL